MLLAKLESIFFFFTFISVGSILNFLQCNVELVIFLGKAGSSGITVIGRNLEVLFSRSSRGSCFCGFEELNCKEFTLGVKLKLRLCYAGEENL